MTNLHQCETCDRMIGLKRTRCIPCLRNELNLHPCESCGTQISVRNKKCKPCLTDPNILYPVSEKDRDDELTFVDTILAIFLFVVIVPAPVILAGYFGGFEIAITVLVIVIILLGIFIFFTLSEENPLQSGTWTSSDSKNIVKLLLYVVLSPILIVIFVLLVITGIRTVKDKNYPLE